MLRKGQLASALDSICANTPAAKGRVERANQTLQDRLVKEMRLRGISDRAAGNVYLPEFMADFNRRFAREPLNSHDAHRPLLPHEDLMRVFTWQEERRLTDNLTLHYKRVMYIVEPSAAAESARGKRVLVVESEDGSVHIEYQGVELVARAFAKDARVSQAAIVENKALSGALLAIQAKQRERDQHTLGHRRLTLREEDHLKKAMGRTGQEHRRSTTLSSEPEQEKRAPSDPLLGRALAWAQDFAPTAGTTKTARSRTSSVDVDPTPASA